MSAQTPRLTPGMQKKAEVSLLNKKKKKSQNGRQTSEKRASKQKIFFLCIAILRFFFSGAPKNKLDPIRSR